jgi:hypothetical protein
MLSETIAESQLSDMSDMADKIGLGRPNVAAIPWTTRISRMLSETIWESGDLGSTDNSDQPSARAHIRCAAVA